MGSEAGTKKLKFGDFEWIRRMYMQADKANKLQREQDLCRVLTSEFHLPEEAVIRSIVLSKA